MSEQATLTVCDQCAFGWDEQHGPRCPVCGEYALAQALLALVDRWHALQRTIGWSEDDGSECSGGVWASAHLGKAMERAEELTRDWRPAAAQSAGAGEEKDQ